MELVRAGLAFVECLLATTVGVKSGKVLFPSQTNDGGALKLDWLNQSRLPANCVLFEIGVHGAAYRRIEVCGAKAIE